MYLICLVCVGISIIKCLIFYLLDFHSYYILLNRFPRGQLQPVVFSSSSSHRSLTNILCICV
ncbi:hypothetical protein BUZ08_13940 [Staphylococcus gallinarum]|nr:hypothetical protein [Staphylococcus gallinarum]PTL13049.1 hypothetical protein BUZ08_13940 [Staphylococcus gallinarum]RIO80238.1 hypothetical protein BUZ07_03245 [Staphylococcus gallinarum]